MSDFSDVEAGIRQLHARYLDAVWRKDYPAFGDCFTEDCEWRIAGQVLQGRAQVMAFLEKAMGNFHRVIMTFPPRSCTSTAPDRRARAPMSPNRTASRTAAPDRPSAPIMSGW